MGKKKKNQSNEDGVPVEKAVDYEDIGDGVFMRTSPKGRKTFYEVAGTGFVKISRIEAIMKKYPGGTLV